MSEILGIIQNRATCRSFKEQAIPSDVMNQLLKAACQGPSGGGFQHFSIIRINAQDKKDALANLCRGQSFIRHAPESLLFCVDFRRTFRMASKEPFPFDDYSNWFSSWMGIIDAAISAQTVVLTAEGLGLKSVYVGNILLKIDEVSKLFGLPKLVVPVIMLTLGVPRTAPKVSRKFGPDILVHDNGYKDLPVETLLEALHDKYADWKMKPREAIVERILESARKQGGEALEKAVGQDIQERQGITALQYWFGAYYPDEPPIEFHRLVEYLEGQGITL